ncbi:alpha/beta fold hydrolase [Streptomyces albus]
MKKASTVAVAFTLSVAAVAGGIGFTAGASQAEAEKKPRPVVQNTFDPLGPPMHSTEHAGRTVHYSDTGEKDATPVVFMGGTGTTARASGMTEFLRTTRQKLGLRLISVERNGFGDTEYDAKLGFDDYTADVRAVLDELGIRKAAVVAISGGGPYAAHFAADAPERISSLHLAAALPPYGEKADYCGKSDAELREYFGEQIRDPRSWWGFPADSPMHKIPGFTDTAEGTAGARTTCAARRATPRRRSTNRSCTASVPAPTCRISGPPSSSTPGRRTPPCRRPPRPAGRRRSPPHRPCAATTTAATTCSTGTGTRSCWTWRATPTGRPCAPAARRGCCRTRRPNAHWRRAPRRAAAPGAEPALRPTPQAERPAAPRGGALSCPGCFPVSAVFLSRCFPVSVATLMSQLT